MAGGSQFFSDLTVLPSPGIMVYIWGIIPIAGPTFQVSELLQFAQIHDLDANWGTMT